MSTPDITNADTRVELHADKEHDHPGDLLYAKVFVLLVAVTTAEVLTYTFDMRGTLLIAALMPMMIFKFGVVAAYFMHLRFDARLFTWVFVVGIILAIGVYIVALSTFHFFS